MCVSVFEYMYMCMYVYGITYMFYAHTARTIHVNGYIHIYIHSYTHTLGAEMTSRVLSAAQRQGEEEVVKEVQGLKLSAFRFF